MNVVALAGGVGGAKLAQGLARAVAPGALTVIVNTGDDFDLYGLRICPDLDTVLYTLAGIANPATGWGIAGDTSETLKAITRYGREPWFQLGDQDFATHILRSERLRSGATLTEVTADFARALGVASAIVPMSDQPVATAVTTPDGQLPFQDYFVARRQTDDVLGVTFLGIDAAVPVSAGLDALAAADVIVICPSNPIVSLGPILALHGMREALARAAAPVVAVSPIVGGKALKGPAAKMLATLGREVSALGVARLYQGLIDGFVLDEQDHALAPQIAEIGASPLLAQTVMGGPADRERLGREILDFARQLQKKAART